MDPRGPTAQPIRHPRYGADSYSRSLLYIEAVPGLYLGLSTGLDRPSEPLLPRHEAEAIVETSIVDRGDVSI
jgi:hypothetical protein